MESVTERRRDAAAWIATCGGLGYMPLAPGSAGSALGIGIVIGIGRLPLERLWLAAIVVISAAAIGAVGVWASGGAEKYFGCIDPKQVVIDEVVGQMLALFLWPSAAWPWLLTGFLIFRVCDVVKPFPIRRLERAPGGWGIMLDDVGAGIYSLVVLAAIRGAYGA
jgi:phosphatidylglycerophosphatase A